MKEGKGLGNPQFDEPLSKGIWHSALYIFGI